MSGPTDRGGRDAAGSRNKICDCGPARSLLLVMGASMRQQAWLAVLCCVCGCDSAFFCTDDLSCRAGGTVGVCEPTGFCSFADSRCLSGRRYGRLADPEYAGQCVEATDEEASPNPSPSPEASDHDGSFVDPAPTSWEVELGAVSVTDLQVAGDGSVAVGWVDEGQGAFAAWIDGGELVSTAAYGNAWMLSVAPRPGGGVAVAGQALEQTTIGSTTLAQHDKFIAMQDAAGSLDAVYRVVGASAGLSEVSVDAHGTIHCAGASWGGAVMVDDAIVVAAPAYGFQLVLRDEASAWTGAAVATSGQLSVLGGAPELVVGTFTGPAVIAGTSLGGDRDGFILQGYAGPRAVGGEGSQSVTHARPVAGGVVVAGTFTDELVIDGEQVEAWGAADVFLARFDDTLQLEWLRPLRGGTAQIMGFDAKDSGVVVAGTFSGELDLGDGTTLAGGEGFVLSLASDGTPRSSHVHDAGVAGAGISADGRIATAESRDGQVVLMGHR